jgi:geranylgeranylglycerol-phosphate geranylgeranyltransferase
MNTPSPMNGNRLHYREFHLCVKPALAGLCLTSKGDYVQLPMGYIKILRPLNCAITFISVCVGAWVGASVILSPALILAAMIGFVVCAFGNIVNDLFDITIDRVNNPGRPLVKGTVSKPVVIALAVYFFILAFLFALSLGTAPFIIVLATLVALFLYAWVLKKSLAANIVVSVLTGLSFVLGGLVVKNPACVYPFLFSFLIHLSREIIKDVIDKQGDQQCGVRSLPIVFGDKKACTISAFSLLALCIMLPIPFITRTLGIGYLLVVAIGAIPACVYMMIKISRCPPRPDLMRYSCRIKVVMAIGLIAMII